jgi:hypothetical protein
MHPVSTPLTAEELPLNLGKYVLRRILGSGASATVFFADDPFNACNVAIKVIRLGPPTGLEAGEVDGSIESEAALLGKIDHPHIVRILDVVDIQAAHYVVMEYVDGGSIERYCRRGALLEWTAILDIVFKCGKALQYMAGMGLVHRDIKPANILLTGAGDIRISDLGATLFSQQGQSGDISIGTPFYMSPEQLLFRPLDFRTDMFSLGVVFYELLTGEKPFTAESSQSLLVEILNTRPKAPSVRRPSVPREIDAVVARMLAPLPSGRFDSWELCLDAIAAVQAAMFALEPRSPVASMGLSERFRLLRDSAFFAIFSDADIWYVLELGAFVEIAEGDVLITEGDHGGYFIVLLEGQVRISKQGRTIDMASPGMSMGELSYVLEGRGLRATTCVAVSEGVVFRIEDQALRDASQMCRSRFEKTFLQTMASWLVDANTRLSAMP